MPDYLLVAEHPDSITETESETMARLRASDTYLNVNDDNGPEDAFAAGWKAAKVYYKDE